jgi:proteasome lid subunit RPN8/RPN11
MIVLTADQVRAITEAALAAWPREACGLLVGRGRRVIRVSRVVPAANLATALDRFDLDPRVRLAVEREVRDTPERVVGHYHSHPDGSATPSATDIAQAWEPELVWLIAGVADGRLTGLSAHHLDRESGRARPVRLETEKNACNPPPIPT